eukprot:scaffold31083_cov14-Tisochrysis_lutea.AAC.1
MDLRARRICLGLLHALLPPPFLPTVSRPPIAAGAPDMLTPILPRWLSLLWFGKWGAAGAVLWTWLSC